MSQSKLWETIEKIVKSHGLELFDIEVPPGPTGTLRVFISRPSAAGRDSSAATGGVQLQDCAAVSREILDHPEVEQLVPGEQTIEVSSPGVNRKLSRPEHFRGAIGERVRLKFAEPDGKNRVVFGTLLSCSDQGVDCEDETSHERVSVAFGNLRQARVDFLFEKGMK